MMDGGEAKAKRYRKHAKGIRHIAEDVRGDSERKQPLAAAKEFEGLADELDRRNSN
jgi:hypothetical protein